jgi:hypothetical protein
MKNPFASWFPLLGRACVLTFFVTVALVGPLRAETTTGSIIGTVYDEAGNPLSGARITAIKEDDGTTRTGITGADGSYRIPLLPPGRYTIRATTVGRQDALIRGFRVPLNEKATVVPPLVLQPATAPTVAVVTNGTTVANLVAVEDPTRRGNFTDEQIRALPLGGTRSFDRLALLLPGVAPPPETIGANGPGVGPGVGTAGEFSANGNRARANNFTVDGSDNNDQDIGVRRRGFTVAVPQPLESVTEIQVATLLPDAEAGRNTGAQVNVVSKGGGNDVHGEAYGFLTDSALNARDFFDYSGPLSGALFEGVENPEEQPFTRYQVGAAAGGPIVRNRWHLFGAVERLKINANRELHFVTPTRAERNRDLRLANSESSRFFGFDVLFPEFYPEPNNPGGPYGANTVTQFLETSGEGWLATAKTDYQFAPWSRPTTLSVRYDFTDDETLIPSVDDAVKASLLSRTRTHNVAAVVNTQVGEHDSNQIRLSFGRTSLGFDEVPGSRLVFESPFGLSGPVGRILYTPYSPLGVDPFTFPQGRANNTVQLADTYHVTRGDHGVKFGVDIRRVQLNSFLDRNYRGQLTFSSGILNDSTGQPQIVTGATFAAFGIPSDFLQALAVEPNSSLALRFWETNLFVHDSWRAHPQVTLTLGLRYEANTVPDDASQRLDAALEIARTAAFPGDPTSPADAQFFATLDAQRSVLGERERIYEPDRNNFAPRVGAAWDVGGRGRYTLRAGYGLYYDPILGTVVSQSRNVFPSFIPINFVGVQRFLGSFEFNPALYEVAGTTLVDPGGNTFNLPVGDIAATLGGLFLLDSYALGFTLPERNLRTPYVHHYGVTAEAALFDRYVASAAYVGTSGRQLIRFRTPNGGPFTVSRYSQLADAVFPLAFLGAGRPEPLLGSYTVIESSASSNYNSLQASLARRYDAGLTFQLSYTWAHAIDDVSDVFEVAGAPLVAQDEVGSGVMGPSPDGGLQFDRSGLRLERGDASFDVRHRFTASWIYDLPWGGESLWAGGWQLSGIATLQTGQPYTVNSSFDANFDGNLTDRLDTTRGLTFFDEGRVRIVRDPSLPFTAFLAPLDPINPQNGSVGRNTFRAQGIASVDLGLAKRFLFGDDGALTVRGEAFNAFNRTHFGIPVRILESPGFGSSVRTTVPARVVQFSARYTF